MKKSLARLSFFVSQENSLKIPHGPVWYSTTMGCLPNDWSVCIKYTTAIQSDNTVIAEVDFMMPAADYLLEPGAKFQLFGCCGKFECQVEVLSRIDN